MKIAIVGNGTSSSGPGQEVGGLGAHDHLRLARSRGGARAGIAGNGRPQRLAARMADAVRRSSVIVLAAPFTAVRERLELAGDVAGKLIIDCTNPIAPGLRPMFDNTTSGAEQIAGWAPRARVVKAFNTTGAENMADPLTTGRRRRCSYAATTNWAKARRRSWPRNWASEVVDAGVLSAARHLENLALLWIHLARVTVWAATSPFA